MRLLSIAFSGPSFGGLLPSGLVAWITLSFVEPKYNSISESCTLLGTVGPPRSFVGLKRKHRYVEVGTEMSATDGAKLGWEDGSLDFDGDALGDSDGSADWDGLSDGFEDG